MNTKLSQFNKSHSKEIYTVFGLIVIAIIYRLFLMRFNYAIGWDEPHYLQIAASFANGKISQALHPYWTPIYPAIVAIFSFLFNDFELAGRLVSIIFGSLILFPIYFLTLKLYGRKSAIYSSILLALYPQLAFFSTSCRTESVFIFFIISGIYFGWLALEKKSYLLISIASIFFALSYLTKPEGAAYQAIFLTIICIYGLYEYLKKREYKIFKFIFLSAIIFFGMASPYIYYLHEETGKWTLSSKVTANQQLGAEGLTDSDVNFSDLSEDNKVLPIDAIYHEGNFLKLINDGKQETRPISISLILKKLAKNYFKVLKYNIPQIFGTALFLLFILGLFNSMWFKDMIALNTYLLTFIGIFWLILIPMFFIVDRYLFPGLTICFIWMGNGVTGLTDWVVNTASILVSSFKKINDIKYLKNYSLAFVCSFIFLFSFGPELGKIVSRYNKVNTYYFDAVELKEAGLWLKKYSNNSPVLMSTNKAVDFYAGSYNIRKGASFTNVDYNRLIEYAKHKDVEYLVLAERYIETDPKLHFLFNNSKIPENLCLIYEDNENSSLSVRIFKINY